MRLNGQIIKALSGFYYVKSDNQIYQCKARGKFRNDMKKPLVGDYVEFSVENINEGYILKLNDRKNFLIRPPICNVDQAFLVFSAKEPDMNTLLLDRFLMLIEHNYIQPIIRYELTDRVIVHDELCKCGKKTRWLEIEGRTDEILEFDNGVLIAPMSLYKILAGIKEVIRFQIIQKSYKVLELRIVADEKDVVFEKLKSKVLEFLNSKNVLDIEIVLSDKEPEVNKISGKYKHIYKDF